MEHGFMKAFFFYRQQRSFEQEYWHLPVLFHHFQCLISLISSPWIWWCAANLHCYEAANKNVKRTKTSSFPMFFLEAAELFTAVWETPAWFVSPCSVVLLCIPTGHIWGWGVQRDNGFTICHQWREEGTYNCSFSKRQWWASRSWLMPFFSSWSFAIHCLSHLPKTALERALSVGGCPL